MATSYRVTMIIRKITKTELISLERNLESLLHRFSVNYFSNLLTSISIQLRTKSSNLCLFSKLTHINTELIMSFKPNLDIFTRILINILFIIFYFNSSSARDFFCLIFFINLPELFIFTKAFANLYGERRRDACLKSAGFMHVCESLDKN